VAEAEPSPRLPACVEKQRATVFLPLKLIIILAGMSAAAAFPASEPMTVKAVRDLALRAFRDAIDAVGPERLVSDALSCTNGTLRVADEDIPIPNGVKLVAFGKVHSICLR
jgi:hypothetical protein